VATYKKLLILLDVHVTWPNSGNLEFGCIRDAWLACATWVVVKLGQLPATLPAHLLPLNQKEQEEMQKFIEEHLR